jgi:hypothetical protein
LLTDDEIAGMRATAGAALPDTAIVQAKAFVSDGGGGGSTGWTASGTLPCRISPVTGSGSDEREAGDRISANAEFVVTLPVDAVVSTEHRLVIAGDVYNVEAVRTRSWNLTTRVEVLKEA